MKRILVAGATGYLGRYVVKELKKQGFYVKALIRDPDKLRQTGKSLAPSIMADVDEIVIGDVTKPETLTQICRQMDYVFSSVGITTQSKGLTFEEVDYQGNLNLLQEAERSQVAAFMYIHVNGVNNWQNPGSLIHAKNYFVQALCESQVNHIIIRPTGYFSDMAQLLSMAKNGRAYLIGDGSARINPIHGEDLAQFCVHALTKTNQVLDVGGPEVLSYENIATTAFEVLARKKRITHLPVFVLNAVAFGLKWFSENYEGLFRFMINVMSHDIIAPKYGHHRVKDFFHEINEKELSNDR